MKEVKLHYYSCSGDIKESTSISDSEIDIFRSEYPEHVKRIAMAAPRFAIAKGEDKKMIADLYEVDYSLLDKITERAFAYESRMTLNRI
mgnify:CR=1 FL=1|jgi:hypothetical protein